MIKDLAKYLTGKSEDHLDPILDNSVFLLHKEAIENFYKLKSSCAKKSFDLKIVSSFRSFEKQLQIWNAKASGSRAILDDQSNVLNPNDLSPKELLLAIMRWSAMPGMSRHHWGSDFDVVDGNKLNNDYQIQLTPEETAPSGIFGELHLYLDELINNNKAFNFYRPYENDLGGVAPEKWHLSYAPVSDEYIKALSFEFFDNFLKAQNPNEFYLLDIILENKKEVYERFIINLSSQPL